MRSEGASAKAHAGIALVMGGTALFGLSRLFVNLRTVDLYSTEFLVRLAACCGAS